MSEREQELKVSVEGEQLVIRIGIAAMVSAAERSEGFQPFNKETREFDQWKIRGAMEFAKAVANHLHDEEEDGSTPVTRILDDAFLEALEDGCMADLVSGEVMGRD